MRRTILAVLASLSLVGSASGAETEQKYGFSPDAFEIKFYIQPRYSWFSENIDIFDGKLGAGTDNAFSVRRSRIYLTSNVTPSIRGRLQLEAKPDKMEALDVYFDWTMPMKGKKPLTFRVGQFKKAFSYQEFGMDSHNLNLIDRTYSNFILEKKLLASARDQGIMAMGDLWEYNIPIQAYLGVFNGNGLGNKFDGNSGKQVVGRVDVTPVTGVTVGANAEMNRRGYESDSTRTADYVVWGGFLVLAKSGFQVVGEVFGGDNSERIVIDAEAVENLPTFFSWYAEAIYRAKSGWEPAARVEIFDPDTDTENDGRTVLTGQIAYSFSKNFRWQVNVARVLFQDDVEKDLTGVYSQWTIRL